MGGGRGSRKLKGGTRESADGGHGQSQEEGCDGGSHGKCSGAGVRMYGRPEIRMVWGKGGRWDLDGMAGRAVAVGGGMEPAGRTGGIADGYLSEC